VRIFSLDFLYRPLFRQYKCIKVKPKVTKKFFQNKIQDTVENIGIIIDDEQPSSLTIQLLLTYPV
jgi:hypothetical protein